VKAPRDVWFVETLVGQLRRGWGSRSRSAQGPIEEVEALAVDEIAALPRLEALILGVGDLSRARACAWAMSAIRR
jgi:hypothetical protein